MIDDAPAAPGLARSILRAARPRQWLKNLLVAAAPLAAGSLLQPRIALITLIAVLLFCAASSGIYFVNDLIDRDDDRSHPVKRNRPIASGALKPIVAWVIGIALLVLAPGLALVAGLTDFAIVLGAYEVIQLSYCLWLKHVVVVDIVVVSSGFLLRAVAGGAAVGVELSQWFLIVAAFGSLFMVAGKRYSEKLHVDQENGRTRRTLEAYSLSYLRFVWSIAAGIVLVAYALWAFELGRSAQVPLATISIVPMTIALLRYAYSIDSGRAGSPEDTVLGDRQLLVLGLVWFVVFAVAVAVG